jgi:hypothetical protein
MRAALALLALCAYSLAAPSAVPLSLGVHHFVDAALLASSSGTYVAAGVPVKDPTPLLTPEHPWEAAMHFYTSSVSLPAAGGLPQYLLYYACSDAILFFNRISLCVANSSDGVTWQKPLLDIHPYTANGTRPPEPTNIVFITEANTFGLQAIVDPRPGGAAGVSLYYESTAKRFVFAASALDGFFFTPSAASNATDSTPALPYSGLADTMLSATYSAASDAYRIFGRADKGYANSTYGCPGANAVFRVVVVTQKACAGAHPCSPIEPSGWTEPEAILAPGTGGDELDCLDNYDAAALAIPDAGTGTLYVMMPSSFRHMALADSGAPDTRAGANDGVMDIRLAVSRSGTNFSFPSRDAFISRGIGARDPESGLYNASGSERDAGFVFATAGGVIDADPASPTISVLFWGSQTTHAGGGAYLYRYSGAFTGIFRARLRREGWAALATLPSDPVGTGAAETVPLLLPVPAPGSALFLRLNADISVAGTLNVSFVDAATRAPLPGFGPGDCAALHGNAVRQLVTCVGAGAGGDLAALAARALPVVIQLALVHTKLYAWEFALT